MSAPDERDRPATDGAPVPTDRAGPGTDGAPDHDHLRDEANREEFAIRRLEAAMAAEERELEHEMHLFEEDEDATKRGIAAEWRKEHWGHEPERPPPWDREPPS